MNTENINIEDIKVGETYNVRMFVSHYSKGIISCCTVIGYDEVDGIQCGEEYDICHDEIAAFFPITPENGTKNSEPATKYDPCRFFRKGDKVRVVARNGRNWADYDPYCTVKEGDVYTVLEDEEDVIDGGCGDIRISNGTDDYAVPFYFLELVTPVEELEPYNVKFLQAGEIPYTYYYWAVMDNMGHEVARFWHEQYEKGQAEAAAEAECARLNAEYRKEQNNA